MKVIKRDGHMVEYSPEKIENAILKANKDVSETERASSVQIRNIIKYIEGLGKKRILVEDIQDIIEIKLMSIGKFALAKKYITYRYTRELVRKSNTTDVAIKKLISGNSEYWVSQNSNKDTKLVSVQRDYLASITSTDISRRFLLPEDVVKAHDEGILYFHNMNYFAQNALCNSSVINLFDMLQNGCNINGVNVSKPQNFNEAVDVTIRILSAIINSQIGDVTISLSHLTPFVVDSYKQKLKKCQLRYSDKDLISKYATEDLKEEISYGINNLIYGINSLMINNDSSINLLMYLGESKQYKQEQALLIEEILKQNISINGKDVYSGNVDFPLKLIFVLEETVVNGEYNYLMDYVRQCILNKISLSLLSEKMLIEVSSSNKEDVYINECMNLSFLSDGKKEISYGHFNQGVVTLNLVDVALSSDKDIDEFWKILDERLELCHRALQIQHKRLSGIASDSAPILWQYGAISRLGKNENIHNLLHDGYSTLSLGFVGLDECVSIMKGNSFGINDEIEMFALKIIEKFNLKCKRWSDVEKISYKCYGICNKDISNKFVSCLKEKFGVIRGITDKEYISDFSSTTNNILTDICPKIAIQSKIQKMILGTAKICLEVNDDKMDDEQIKAMLDYIYENILHIQLNFKLDICNQCGYVGVFKKMENLNRQCPNCKNEEIKEEVYEY